MKKFIYSITIVMFFLFIFVPTQSMAKSITLSYSSFFPPTHIQAKIAESWCKEVAKQTDGRVKVNFYPGQTLTKAPQTYEAIVDGIADIGTSALAYTQGRFPVMASMDLPFGYPSGVAATAVANKLYNKMQPEEFSQTKVLFFNSHGPGYIHTRNEPVKTLEDLKGKRIRSTGMSANVVEALGATPVSMAMPDTYQALQRGVVDGSIHPVEVNKGWNMGEVVDFATVTDATAYTTTFFVVMNKDKWNSIDSKDQKAIEKINKEWARKHGEAWDSSDEEGMEFFKNQGGEIIELTENQSQKWQGAVEPVFENYIEKLNERGLDGEAIISYIENKLEAYK